jgi:hypothetical protein
MSAIYYSEHLRLNSELHSYTQILDPYFEIGVFFSHKSEFLGFVENRPKLITYLKALVKVNPMSMSPIFYIRPYIISISGTLKHKFELKLR